MQPLHLYISANGHTEIGRLLNKYNLRINQVDCTVFQKIVYIDKRYRNQDEGALWKMPCRRGSIRRTKKAIKTFLRRYDKSTTTSQGV